MHATCLAQEDSSTILVNSFLKTQLQNTFYEKHNKKNRKFSCLLVILHETERKSQWVDLRQF